MRCFDKQYQIKELVTGLEGKLLLTKDVVLDNVAELKGANEKSVCFFEDDNYLKDLTALEAGLLIVPSSFDPSITPGVNLFFVQKPYQTFNELVRKWLLVETPAPVYSVHPSAIIAPDALIQKNVSIGENVVIGSRTRIGIGSVIEANAVIGANVVIGEDCFVRPNSTIYPYTEIGNRVIIHSGAVLGSDGFGYNFDGKAHLKIHHVGKVVVGDDVEIGANSCIDRATIGQTRIGKGTKIDNLVQVGHNCTIGNHAILCSQVGLAGNTEVGNYVYLAGQVGAAGHLKIHDGAMVGAQSGISRDIPPNGKFFGTPAIDAQLQKRIIVAIKKLPELLSWFNKFKKNSE